MSQTSYNLHVNRALQAIAQRFKNETPPECITQIGPIPPYTNSFTQQVNIDENVSTNSGQVSDIDVQPDYRMIILSLNYYITSMYPEMNFKPYPAMTPPALMAYYLALFYVFALLNDDANIRHQQSAYAHQVSTTRNLDRILYKLRRLPVPKFIIEMLLGLQRGYDQRKQHMKFVNTLACYDLTLDFGRTPPIAVYLAAHNVIASIAPNNTIPVLLNHWYQTQILSLPTELRVANYLGIADDETTYLNWFAHMNTTLFNPVNNRSQTVRPTTMPMPLFPQSLGNDTAVVNPYIHLLGLDNNNLNTVETILGSIATCISETYSDCKQIGSIIDIGHNTLILNHMYLRTPVPTWHHRKIINTRDGMTFTDVTTYTTRNQFKTTPTFGDIVTIKYPESSTYDRALYLIKAKKYDKTKSPISFSIFNPLTDVNPDVRHFCPFESGTNQIHSNIIIGRLIECDELTSVDVPQPNPLNGILKENCYYLESAVPFDSIRSPNFINAQNPSHSIRTRTPLNPRTPTTRMSLIDRAIDRLPRFGPQIIGEVPATLPGYHATEHIPSTSYGSTSICYTIKQGSIAPDVPTGITKISAWSSYRWLNPYSHTSVNIRNRKFMLLNFRTQHGTNVTLVETPHPALCIPRS